MKRTVILLVDADVDTYTATLSAAQAAGFAIRAAQIQRHLSEINDFELDDVAAIVLDSDPDIQGPAIATELPHWLPPRPVVLVSSHCEHELVFQGAMAQPLVKPVSAAQIIHALDAILCHEPGLTCDRWGHLAGGRQLVV